MKHTTLLLTIALSAFMLAACEKKSTPQAHPPAQADTTALSEGTEPAASAQTAQAQPTASAGGYAYSGSDDIDSVAWYYQNSGGTAHEVTQKKYERVTGKKTASSRAAARTPQKA